MQLSFNAIPTGPHHSPEVAFSGGLGAQVDVMLQQSFVQMTAT